MLSIEQLVAFAQEQPTSVVLPVVATALLGAYTLLSALTRNSKTKSFTSYVYPQSTSTVPFLGNTLDMAYSLTVCYNLHLTV